MPSKQETFDTVVAHLRKQGCKSENDEYCLYRGDAGKKCAAGCLIPDEMYSPDFEKTPIMWTDSQEINLVGKLIESLGHEVSLVSSLQRIHDKSVVERWEIGFRSVAREHGLIYSPPEAAHAD